MSVLAKNPRSENWWTLGAHFLLHSPGTDFHILPFKVYNTSGEKLHLIIILIYPCRNEVFPCENDEGVPLSTMIKIVNSVETEVSQEGKVVVHCRFGQGRTGTVLGKGMMLQCKFIMGL